MGTASLSGVIIAPSVDIDDPPCQVIQQQDTDDTAPCTSGGASSLNQMLRMLGVEIPAPKESETYSSSLTVKPKNVYTSLNISMTHGDLSSPTYNSLINEARLDVSTGDWRLDDGSYYIDIRPATGLVESDNITSAAWSGTPINDDLELVSPKPTISTTSDDLLKSNKPANGVVSIKYVETTATYNFDVNPREDVDSGFYNSSLVINADGCNEKPFFYEIKVPSCYEQSRLAELASLSDGDSGDGDVNVPPPYPKGGERYDCEYCLCTLRLKSATVRGMCSGTEKDTGKCKSGPSHKDC